MVKLLLYNASKAMADINLFSGGRLVLQPSASLPLPDEEKLTPELERYYSQLKVVGVHLVKVVEKVPTETEVPTENEVPTEVLDLQTLMKKTHKVLVTMAEEKGIEVKEGMSKKEISKLILGEA